MTEQVKKSNIVQIGIFAIASLLFFFASVICQTAILFPFAMILWAALVWYALKDIKNRIVYLTFLGTFFLFLLGGDFFEAFFGFAQEFEFTKKLDNHAYLCLIISLVFIHIGYLAVEKLTGKKDKTLDGISFANGDSGLLKFQKAMLVLIYITAIPFFITIIDAAVFSLQNGYLSYYTEYKSRVPSIIESASDLFLVFFFLYLASMPKKKTCYIPMVIYLSRGVLALLTGRRIMFGVAILVLCAYIIIRHKLNPEEKWIDKKKIIIALVLLPIVLVVLYAQRYIRYGEAIEVDGPISIIFRFLSQQGTSINVIKFQKQFEGDPLGCTSLYYTLHYLRGNLLTRGLFDFPMEYYLEKSFQTVYETNCLADYIMYRVNPKDFFDGYGLGTSYIAELHHDLGYVGVALGSVVYGALLNWLYSPKNYSFLKFSLGLIALEEFVILPRYGADVIMRPFYNLTRLGTLFIITLVYLILRKRAKAKRGNEVVS